MGGGKGGRDTNVVDLRRECPMVYSLDYEMYGFSATNVEELDQLGLSGGDSESEVGDGW